MMSVFAAGGREMKGVTNNNQKVVSWGSTVSSSAFLGRVSLEQLDVSVPPTLVYTRPSRQQSTLLKVTESLHGYFSASMVPLTILYTAIS